jgi:CBS domain-containing protein
VAADARAIECGDPLRVEEFDHVPRVRPSAAKVADAMNWGLVRCAPDATLREVAALMADAVVHCVVVIDTPGDGASLWGIVSDLDLVAAATVRSLDDQRAAGTAMRPAITAFPHESLEAAAERMTTHGVSHLVVVDDVRRRPVGVMSTLDLVRRLAGESAAEVQSLPERLPL